MGRTHTPSAILEAKGSYLHNPQLKRPNEPRTTKPLGPAPKWLTDDEKTVWKDLAKQALPGVLMFSDRAAFEMLVCLTTVFRARAKMSQGDKSLMLILLSHFAMTPSDRAKVQVEQPKESKLAKFLKQPKTGPRPPVSVSAFDPHAPVN
jgi:hypothetical protein